MYVNIDMQKSKSLNSTSFLQFTKGCSKNLVTNSCVSKFQTEFLSSEVLKILLPKIVTVLKGLDCERDAGLLLSLSALGLRSRQE